MEEWHQKLHNNTSPDDIIICQALIEYLKADLDLSAYWKTLQVRFSHAEATKLLGQAADFFRTMSFRHPGSALDIYNGSIS